MGKAITTDSGLPPIPSKQYFSISEVSELCDVKNHVLRYWEQEFPDLRPVKKRGNRRYYQHADIILIRKIRDLLYQQGFTINGARAKLHSNQPTIPIQQKPDTEVVSKSIRRGFDLRAHIRALEQVLEILE